MIVCGDARKIPLPDESVQCVVTSPPYWGLRKYSGNQELVWGGRADCAHDYHVTAVGDTRALHQDSARWNHEPHPGGAISPHIKVALGQSCIRCGAWRGAYGLEPTIEMYVEHTVAILREIRRVLRSDGVCFWNIGDSYFNCTYIRHKGSDAFGNAPGYSAEQGGGVKSGKRRSMARTDDGLKMKDLCLIPQRVALAAQADGWWVRSDIIWAKSNPMPESVTDRPADAYEHILELGKSRPQLSDIEAAWLAASLDSDGCIRIGIYRHRKQAVGYAAQICFDGRSERLVRRVADVAGVGSATYSKGRQAWAWRTSSGDAAWLLHQVLPYLVNKREQACLALELQEKNRRVGNGAVPPEKVAEAHRLFELCKKLNGHKGAKEGYEPISEEDYSNILMLTKSLRYYWNPGAVREEASDPGRANWQNHRRRSSELDAARPPGSGPHTFARLDYRSLGRNLRNVWTFPTQPYAGAHFGTYPEELVRRCLLAATSAWGACRFCGAPWERIVRRSGGNIGNPELGTYRRVSVGWRPTCLCRGQHGRTVPCLVLDPFGGSGTTLRVALELGRRCVSLDLTYHELALERARGVQTTFRF